MLPRFMLHALAQNIANPIRGLATTLLLIASATTFAFAPGSALAQAESNSIAYHGELVDAAGNALAGRVAFELRIFDAPEAGNLLYAESHVAVSLADDGSFVVALGGGSNPDGSFDAGLFAPGRARYLETVVDTEVMSPRQKLGTVPWAFVAREAMSLANAPTLVSDVSGMQATVARVEAASDAAQSAADTALASATAAHTIATAAEGAAKVAENAAIAATTAVVEIGAVVDGVQRDGHFQGTWNINTARSIENLTSLAEASNALATANQAKLDAFVKLVDFECGLTSPGGVPWNLVLFRECEVLKLTNEYRAKGYDCPTTELPNGPIKTFDPVGPLVMQPQLRLAARLHSEWLSQTGKTKEDGLHDSPGHPNGDDAGERIETQGYKPVQYWGENVFLGSYVPADAVTWWMASPEHCATIMDPKWEDLGVGLDDAGGIPYWTQDFGTLLPD